MPFTQTHRLIGAVIVAGIVASPATTLVRNSHAATTGSRVAIAGPGDAWLKPLKGKHRQLFDAPDPAGGIPLVHVMNFYDTYNKAFNIPDSEINGVLTFYGFTTLYALNDEMWTKYRLGEFLKTNDPKTGAPATINPWRTAPVALGMTLPQASVESLQKRGATFIVCNNALTIFSQMVAQARGSTQEAVYADFKANILPNVTLVPGMVVAIEQAQKAGITYHRQ
jgi:intracellular sulfur oxidation DsrE/DsrF family protein